MERAHRGFGKLFSILLSTLLWTVTSCVSTKHAVYFTDIPEGNITSNLTIPETRIQPNDLLSITISSPNPEAAVPFNPSNIASAQTPGYLVGLDSTIEMPIIGSVKAAGLTKEQLRLSITRNITSRKLLNDPSVSIRFMNFRVTVLGDVGRPGVVTVTNERITLLEAIGYAGDLSLEAKKDNVMIIRENERGQRTIKRVNLNSAELFTSEYYYLKANDVVYVEPGKNKIINSTTRTPQWVSLVLAGVTLAISVATFLKAK